LNAEAAAIDVANFVAESPIVLRSSWLRVRIRILLARKWASYQEPGVSLGS